MKRLENQRKTTLINLYVTFPSLEDVENQLFQFFVKATYSGSPALENLTLGGFSLWMRMRRYGENMFTLRLLHVSLYFVENC